MTKFLIKVLLIPFLIGCAVTQTTTKEKVDNSSQLNKNSGVCSSKEICSSDVGKDADKFNEITMDEVLKLLKKEHYSGILYFGFTNCPWCIEAMPILEQVADNTNTSVKYVKTRNEEGKLLYSEKQKNELYEYIGEYMTKEKNGNIILYVPLVITIKEGEIIGGHCGTVNEHNAHEREMNQDEKNKLEEIYGKMINEIK